MLKPETMLKWFRTLQSAGLIQKEFKTALYSLRIDAQTENLGYGGPQHSFLPGKWWRQQFKSAP